ncbi:MAG: EscU/YscU/HrcU family type III secretion system export apparatus switch protein [Verrucomicrobia bacterium]|nr:EscU/YscU/HrcU family type III secretion system export apparatus switch protein [Verrucomicrobiota bacterium]
MAESAGEKSEKPTGKRISESWSKGQFAKTAEIQTVFVLTAGLWILSTTGDEIIRVLSTSMSETLGQVGQLSITSNSIYGYITTMMGWVLRCVVPLMMAAVVSGVLAGGLQSRFHLTPKRLEANWGRLNPITNLQQFYKPMPSLVRAGTNLLKFIVILGLTYVVIKRLLEHPIFHSATDFEQVLLFMVESVKSITFRVLIGLAVIAAADYGYQSWKTQKDMMMSKEDIKEETKSAEGSPQAKGEMRKRRVSILRQTMMQEIPQADVIVTNPTHLAVALRYDRATMRAPKVIAKGARYNALRIREIAEQFQIPIVENKPVAQMLFKFAKVGQEIPSQVYSAVAEILAYVYRTNKFRYHVQGKGVGT